MLPYDPFQHIDEEGVGQLVRLACERGRETRADLHLGVCGEHGGDPQSIDFFERTGLDYVSCSPYRVPIARLAAARSSLARKAAREETEEAQKAQKPASQAATPRPAPISAIAAAPAQG